MTANNTKNRVTDTDGNLTDRRTMKLLSFNVIALGSDDNYSDILVDRFHLLTDYSYKYYNYDFVNTLGIFEPRNRKSKVYYGGDKLLDYDITGYTKWPGESGSPWTDAGDSIYWNKDVEFLKNINVKMPVYKKTTHKDDIRISEIPRFRKHKALTGVSRCMKWNTCFTPSPATPSHSIPSMNSAIHIQVPALPILATITPSSTGITTEQEAT